MKRVIIKRASKANKNKKKTKEKAPLALANEYLEKRQGLEGKGTFQARKRAVLRFIAFLVAFEIGLMDITKETIKDYFTYLTSPHPRLHKSGKYLSDKQGQIIIDDPLAINTAHQQIALIKSFIRWTYEIGQAPNYDVIYTSTLRKELPKKEKKLPKPPTQETMTEILAAADINKRALIQLLYETGMRISDIIELKINDFNPKKRTLRIYQVKQKTERIVNLTEECVKLLNQYIQNGGRKTPEIGFEEYLFISPKTSKQLTKRSIQRWVKAISSYVGSPITPHKIRSACATHMLENGADIRQVQVIGGWESLSTLEHYAAVSRTQQKKIWNETHPLAKRETENKRQQQEAILKDNTALLSQMEEMLRQMRKISGQED